MKEYGRVKRASTELPVTSCWGRVEDPEYTELTQWAKTDAEASLPVGTPYQIKYETVTYITAVAWHTISDDPNMPQACELNQ